LYMEVFDGIDSIHRPLKNPVLTIGNFDGVHRAHQALFQKVKDWARRLDGESTVMTFHPHPLSVLAPEKGISFITTHERKLELISRCSIDVTIVLPFNRKFAGISAHDFVRNLLVGKLGIKALIVGYDYRFGNRREGNIEFLRKTGRQFGFDVDTVSGIELDGSVVSSTAIRQFIKEGELREANKLLGRPFEITGPVVTGRQRGARLLGFPTANIRIGPNQACPKTGIYAVRVDVGGESYGGAANLGYSPTFGDGELSLEVHILDFNGDIYGKEISVQFIDRLRDEKRFSGPEELAVQIRKDVEKARQLLAGDSP
jgi:riboflavin kinase/FMN adenylyltransferase